MKYKCKSCNHDVELKVLSDPDLNKYYAGYICEKCSFKERFTIYFKNKEDAEQWVICLKDFHNE